MGDQPHIISEPPIISEPWPRKSNRSRLTSRNYKCSPWGNLTKEEASRRKLHLLPALACKALLGEDSPPHVGTFNDPSLRLLLLGTRDKGSNLCTLRSFDSTIIRMLYSYIVPEWSNRVTLTLPAQCVGYIGQHFTDNKTGLIRFSEGRPRSYEDGRTFSELQELNPEQSIVSFAKCGKVEFPEPNSMDVNMMPFIIGDIDSLPEKLKIYYPMIEACPYDDEEIGEVGYLTVHESYVKADGAQRRQGLHIEAPGTIIDSSTTNDDGNGACRFMPSLEHRWGMGIFFGHDRFLGGIYMASSTTDTSEVWDAIVHDGPGIVDGHGGCEHLRSLIGIGTKLEANDLIWMTDRTPHEALSQRSSGNRQFFRMVTSRVSHWFADHCTPNPSVPLPDHVIVVHGNKFDHLD
mmetsp:Transcript_57431/g.69104  ORF Transcript_57431/g.69104 Transcript_57431/m.69104 type:complete len:405 (-) Transcript_57431:15-1229(-)